MAHGNSKCVCAANMRLMHAPPLPHHPRLARCAPEEELAVEVGHVNGVHVDDVDVTESAECQVFQELTAQAAGPHHQDPAHESAMFEMRTK